MSELDLSNVKAGTRVKLMNGETGIVVENDGGGIPVRLAGTGWYHRDGRHAGQYGNLDIVEVLPDEPKTDLPAPEVVSAPTIALRDALAGCAMQGILANSSEIVSNIDKTAEYAYQVADAMLKARAGK